MNFELSLRLSAADKEWQRRRQLIWSEACSHHAQTRKAPMLQWVNTFQGTLSFSGVSRLWFTACVIDKCCSIIICLCLYFDRKKLFFASFSLYNHIVIRLNVILIFIYRKDFYIESFILFPSISHLLTCVLNEPIINDNRVLFFDGKY